MGPPTGGLITETAPGAVASAGADRWSSGVRKGTTAEGGGCAGEGPSAGPPPFEGPFRGCLPSFSLCPPCASFCCFDAGPEGCGPLSLSLPLSSPTSALPCMGPKGGTRVRGVRALHAAATAPENRCLQRCLTSDNSAALGGKGCFCTDAPTAISRRETIPLLTPQGCPLRPGPRGCHPQAGSYHLHVQISSHRIPLQSLSKSGKDSRFAPLRA